MPTQRITPFFSSLLILAILFVTLGLPSQTAQAGSLSNRDTIIARAQSWVTRKIAYNKKAYTDGYRQDCSGYVSYAWGLTTSSGTPDNRYTATLPGVSTRISKDQLLPGDILLNNTATIADNLHTLIFYQWADSSKTSYWAYELSPNYVKFRKTPYPYWPGYESDKYVPMRLNSLINSVPAAPSNASVSNRGTTSMTISWRDNSNNESGFKVYNGYTLVSTVVANSTSATVSNLQPNTWYCFQVKAYNGTGESGWSGWACDWTLKQGSQNAPNLAKGKTSYATSQESSAYPARNGNDGSFSSRWSSANSSSVGSQWYIVDMGSSQSLNQVIVTWEAAYGAHYFVGYSSDCINFYGSWRSRSSAGGDTVTFGTVNARCVGVYMDQRAPRMNNYSIYEVEAYLR